MSECVVYVCKRYSVGPAWSVRSYFECPVGGGESKRAQRGVWIRCSKKVCCTCSTQTTSCQARGGGALAYIKPPPPRGRSPSALTIAHIPT